MGVYINMEMPKGCGVCPFRDEECFGAWKCWRVKDWGDDDHIAKGCPIGPVPPHGRCIDADAMLMLIRHINTEAYMDGVRYGVRPSLEYLDLLEEIIADAPTVLEAEEGET